MDLISRDNLKESLIHCNGLGRKSFEAVLSVIDEQPTTEAVPVVHGEWAEYENEADKGFHYCSKCKCQAFNYEDEREVIEVLSNFCPHCGADMRKKV